MKLESGMEPYTPGQDVRVLKSVMDTNTGELTMTFQLSSRLRDLIVADFHGQQRTSMQLVIDVPDPDVQS